MQTVPPFPPAPADPVPVQPGPTHPGPVNAMPAQPMPAQPMPAQPMPAQPMPAQAMPAQPVPAQPGPVHPGPAQPVPVQPGPVHPGPAGLVPVHPGAEAALADLLRRLPPGTADAVDLDEIVTALESLGISDRTARHRHGVPSVFVLAEQVLARLPAATGQPADTDRPPGVPGRHGHLRSTALRCALQLSVLLAAVAGNTLLSRVAWAVTAAALVLATGGGQALGYAARRVGAATGREPALRTVTGGLLVLGALWCAAVRAAPAEWLGPDRPAAYAVGCAALALAGVVAAALSTGAGGVALRYLLPVWALAAAVASGAWQRLVPPAVDAETVLLVLLAGATLRLLLPGMRRGGRRPAAEPSARTARCTVARLLLGAGQAGAVLLVWQAGPAGTPAPGVLPALVAVPFIELFVGWHVWQFTTGQDRYESVPDYARHVRGVALVTVAALVPPLAVGMALAAAARRLPSGLADHEQARALVLALAAGILLAGVLGATRLLAAHDRVWRATAVAAVPVGLALGLRDTAPDGWWPSLTGLGTGVLPTTVGALAAAQLAGLVAVALTVFDHRSRR